MPAAAKTDMAENQVQEEPEGKRDREAEAALRADANEMTESRGTRGLMIDYFCFASYFS
jgi:hypothetical protein